MGTQQSFTSSGYVTAIICRLRRSNHQRLTKIQALLYLIRKSYATIYYMLTSSEPVSEALLPIYNQLTTLRKCLKEVRKAGGVSTPRELYPYSMKVR